MKASTVTLFAVFALDSPPARLFKGSASALNTATVTGTLNCPTIAP